ncbi:uncharacterized protein LOC128221108 isoform X2 [Mya arenaria]|uniref:uncharacterized protein LOC128221108 isoform X2 n=1 Tax=Mya arenaria TaxID=6604 RepID=UPI0022E11AF6|nr:uncharacterized protein LOC128221108 isoform X2 [Mya arenaria]
MISEALVRFYLANRSEIDNFFQCRLDEVNTLMRMCMPVLTELCRLLLEIGVNVLGLGNLAVHTLAIPMEVISRFAYDRCCCSGNMEARSWHFCNPHRQPPQFQTLRSLLL